MHFYIKTPSSHPHPLSLGFLLFHIFQQHLHMSEKSRAFGAEFTPAAETIFILVFYFYMQLQVSEYQLYTQNTSNKVQN